nr:Scr1 family TA system antitoxin-like transcriptional regulator [Nocardia sp. GTS18]
MVTQIRHLIDILTARDHVRIGIIPLNADFVAPAINFVISNTTSVDSEGIAGPAEYTDSREVELVERTFELLAATAVYGEKPTPSWPGRWPPTASPASDPSDRPRGPDTLTPASLVAVVSRRPGPRGNLEEVRT